MLVGRMILDRRRIEHHDVREVARLQHAAVGERQRGRRQRGELVNRLLEAQQLLFTDVFREQPREVAVGARMPAGFQKHPLGRRRIRIRVEADPGERQLAAHVLLRHQKVGDRYARSVLDHQVDGGVLGTHATHLRDLGERLARQRLELRVLEPEQQRAGGARGSVEVLPRRGRVAHLGEHTRANRRILQPADPGLEAAVLHPRRHGGIEPGRTRRVQVHIRGDADPGGARSLDLVDERVELAPISSARSFQVIDLRRRARGPGDVDGLLRRLEQPIALAAHVHAVDPAAARRLAGERHELGGASVLVRAVDERGGDPEGSFLHRLAHQRAHPLELRGGRLHVALAEHVGADRARAHEGGDIGRNAVPLELVQVLPESGPVDRVVNVGLALPRVALHLRSQRPHRVLAEHLERHSLAQIAQRPAVRDEGLFRVRQHVDEPGRHRLAARLEALGRRPGSMRSHVDDAIAPQGYVAHERWAPRAVVDGAAADHHIVVRSRTACLLKGRADTGARRGKTEPRDRDRERTPGERGGERAGG